MTKAAFDATLVVRHSHCHLGLFLNIGFRLSDILGPEATLEYLKFVLRATSSGLLAGRSERLIRDAKARVIKAVRKVLRKTGDEVVAIVIPDPMAAVVQSLLSGEELRVREMEID